MATLRVQTRHENRPNPVRVLLIETDRVLRQPWIGDADLCALACYHWRADKDGVETHHLAFPRSAIDALTVSPSMVVTCDMDIFWPKDGGATYTWRGQPYAFPGVQVHQHIWTDHHVLIPTYATSFQYLATDRAMAVLAGFFRAVVPAFDPTQHQDPLAAMHRIGAPVGGEGLAEASFLAPLEQMMNIALESWGMKTLPLEKQMHTFMKYGMLLHDRPFQATRRWRDPKFETWASWLHEEGLAMGQACATLLEPVAIEAALTAKAHLDEKLDATITGHRKVEAIHLVEALREAAEGMGMGHYLMGKPRPTKRAPKACAPLSVLA